MKAGLAGAGATLLGKAIYDRATDTIEGQDNFSMHTATEMKNHPISGMHSPYLTKDKELLDLFKNHFSAYAHLLPKSVEDIKEQQAVEMPVRIRPIEESPVPFDADHNVILGAGGAPALISTTAFLDAGTQIVFIRDQTVRPISDGSAFHLEPDAATEAPSSFPPIKFMSQQISRVFNYERYSDIEKTGMFSWRSLDWMGWLHHPEQWLTGFKLLGAVQFANKEGRTAVLNEVAENCKFNETFYHALNMRLGGKLLLPGEGSIIVARNREEWSDMHQLEKDLFDEKRPALRYPDNQEMLARFGHNPVGEQNSEKTHDRVLSPNFEKVIAEEIQKQGGQFINGRITNIYTDGQKGVAEYQTQNETHHISFTQLQMSLGKQLVLDANNKPVYETVAARGVSFLALAFAPANCIHPPVTVYGGTNHVTSLAGPIKVQQEGETRHLFLVRMTAGAAVAPRHCGKEGANYDGSIGFGLLKAVTKSLGDQWMIKPLTAYGCNRQISKNMYTGWVSYGSAIRMQYGAGGGGLTNAALGAKGEKIASNIENPKRGNR